MEQESQQAIALVLSTVFSVIAIAGILYLLWDSTKEKARADAEHERAENAIRHMQEAIEAQVVLSNHIDYLYKLLEENKIPHINANAGMKLTFKPKSPNDETNPAAGTST